MMGRIKRRVARVLSLGILVAGVAPSASALGTANGGIWSAEHSHVTRYALRGQGIGTATMDALAGRPTLTSGYGAVGAPDVLGSPLGGRHEAHCDHGDFLAVPGYPQTQAQARANLTACRKWIDDALNVAVVNAGRLVNAAGVVQTAEATSMPACKFDDTADRGKCMVLEYFGRALHAVQDFYSHTNWVDRPDTGTATEDNPPGLNNQGAAPWLSLRASVPFPEGLISGCYEGKPEVVYCRYGLSNRVKHDYLNKDLGPISDAAGATGPGTTDRGKINENFQRAINAASADTLDKWKLLGERIASTYPGARGQKILCVVKSDAPSDC